MSPQKNNNSAITREPPPALLVALSRLLRPLVKLLLHYQITYPVLSNLLKTIYVQVANEDFSIPGKKQTDSRISLLTGVHRKDIKKRLHEDEGSDSTPQIPLMAQLIATWLSDSRYCDKHGNAQPLMRLKAQEDKKPPSSKTKSSASFESLVESVNKKDLRARVVLDDCLHQNIVHIDTNDLVHLNLDAFVPEQDFDDKAVFFGNNIHDHLSAAGHNLKANNSNGNEDSFFDRGVYYNHLTPESVEKLSKQVSDQGMGLLKSINRQAKELQKADKNKKDARQRINLGLFFFHQNKDDEAKKENNSSED